MLCHRVHNLLSICPSLSAIAESLCVRERERERSREKERERDHRIMLNNNLVLLFLTFFV